MSYLSRLKARIEEKPQRAELTKLTKGASVSFVSSQGDGFCRNEPVEDAISEAVLHAIEERAAICANCVPSIYLDSWARHCHQRPKHIAELHWYRAIDDGGRFLDQWGNEAAALGWTASDLFNVPREGQPGGLIWQLTGDRIETLSGGHARIGNGRSIERRKCDIS
ncbi:MAG: hypothetical protein ABSA13_15580 [Beijerinckiaceae bacterium]|jgi:hypothetical protein